MDKAYSVLELDEWTGGIIFAKDKRTAKRQGAKIWAGGEVEYVEARRMPHLDKYKDTGVPAKVLVAEGWRFECCGCGMQINDCTFKDDGLSISGVVGKESGPIYCSHGCRMESMADDAARKAFGEAFLDMMKDMVRARFPDIEHAFGEHRHHVYVPKCTSPMTIQEAKVSFNLPGMKIGPASLEYHHESNYGSSLIGPVRPEFYCCNGDREAFEAFSRPKEATP